jgi:hypothetical protein
MKENKVWVVKIDGLAVDNHFESLSNAMEWVQVFATSIGKTKSSILIENYIKPEIPIKLM